jgi:hypothetical protein
VVGSVVGSVFFQQKYRKPQASTSSKIHIILTTTSSIHLILRSIMATTSVRFDFICNDHAPQLVVSIHHPVPAGLVSATAQDELVNGDLPEPIPTIINDFLLFRTRTNCLETGTRSVSFAPSLRSKFSDGRYLTIQ